MTMGYVNGNLLALSVKDDGYATDENGQFVSYDRRPINECGVCGKKEVEVQGQDGDFAVDGCMGDLIRELQARGVETTGCCCGHGHEPGYISLGVSVTIDLDIVEAPGGEERIAEQERQHIEMYDENERLRAEHDSSRESNP